MGGRSLTAQWECFPLLGNAAICYSGKAPASDRDRPRTQCLAALLAMLGTRSDRKHFSYARKMMAHVLQQPHMHDSHRHLSGSSTGAGKYALGSQVSPLHKLMAAASGAGS